MPSEIIDDVYSYGIVLDGPSGEAVFPETINDAQFDLCRRTECWQSSAGKLGGEL